MSKGLDALENLRRNKQILKASGFDYDNLNIDMVIIAKELKALEILRNKPFVSMHDIQHFDNVIELNAYLQYMYGYMTTSVLTKEEYELLKEVLL